MNGQRRNYIKVGVCFLAVASVPGLVSQAPGTAKLGFDTRIRIIDSDFIEIDGWVLPRTDLGLKKFAVL